MYFPEALKYIPAEWTEVLKAIQVQFPTAVIAGGALRDLFTGVAIKDIDIFLYNPAGLSEADFAARLSAVLPEGHGYVSELEDFDKKDYDINVSDVSMVLQFQDNPRGFGNPTTFQNYVGGTLPLYQVIVLNKPFVTEKLPDRFDFGVCKIVYDGEAVWADQEFEEDMMRHQFTCVTPRDLETSLRRYVRIRERYPD